MLDQGAFEFGRRGLAEGLHGPDLVGEVDGVARPGVQDADEVFGDREIGAAGDLLLRLVEAPPRAVADLGIGDEVHGLRLATQGGDGRGRVETGLHAQPVAGVLEAADQGELEHDVEERVGRMVAGEALLSAQGVERGARGVGQPGQVVAVVRGGLGQRQGFGERRGLDDRALQLDLTGAEEEIEDVGVHAGVPEVVQHLQGRLPLGAGLGFLRWTVAIAGEAGARGDLVQVFAGAGVELGRRRVQAEDVEHRDVRIGSRADAADGVGARAPARFQDPQDPVQLLQEGPLALGAHETLPRSPCGHPRRWSAGGRRGRRCARSPVRPGPPRAERGSPGRRRPRRRSRTST